eukprot:Nk52_evm1s2197 gene=Nk52_evmTU1s2197
MSGSLIKSELAEWALSDSIEKDGDDILEKWRRERSARREAEAALKQKRQQEQKEEEDLIRSNPNQVFDNDYYYKPGETTKMKLGGDLNSLKARVLYDLEPVEVKREREKREELALAYAARMIDRKGLEAFGGAAAVLEHGEKYLRWDAEGGGAENVPVRDDVRGDEIEGGFSGGGRFVGDGDEEEERRRRRDPFVVMNQNKKKKKKPKTTKRVVDSGVNTDPVEGVSSPLRGNQRSFEEDRSGSDGGVSTDELIENFTKQNLSLGVGKKPKENRRGSRRKSKQPNGNQNPKERLLNDSEYDAIRRRHCSIDEQQESEIMKNRMGSRDEMMHSRKGHIVEEEKEKEEEKGENGKTSFNEVQKEEEDIDIYEIMNDPECGYLRKDEDINHLYEKALYCKIVLRYLEDLVAEREQGS